MLYAVSPTIILSMVSTSNDLIVPLHEDRIPRHATHSLSHDHSAPAATQHVPDIALPLRLYVVVVLGPRPTDLLSKQVCVREC